MRRAICWLAGLVIATDCDPLEPPPTKVASLPYGLTSGQLDVAEREIVIAQNREDDRDRGVQARLVALLGLSSSLAAVVSGTAAFALTIELDATRYQQFAILAALAYIAIQVVASIFFTVRGLLTRGYKFVAPWDAIQTAAEPIDRMRSRLLSEHRSNLRYNIWVTNRRVDEMVLGLRSLRRAAGGAGALLLILGLVILNQRLGVCLDFRMLF